MQQTWRRRIRIGVVGGLLALLAGFAVSGARAAAGEKQGETSPCKRASLTRAPLWTGSGVWNGEDLVLVDTIRRSLLPYSAAGRARLEPRGPLQKALRDLYPVRLAAGVPAASEKASEARLALQVDAYRFLVMDRGYATLGNVSTRLLQAQDGSGATIEKVFDWTLAGKDIVGFAELKGPGDRWFCGPVRFSTEAPNGFQVLKNLPMDDDSRKYHKLGNAYTASLGDTAYYLLMSNGIHLWKHENGREPEDLRDLEADFTAWKSNSPLPSFVNAQDASEIMEAVERSSLPTGLYGWVDPVSQRKALYLVSRQWRDGKTQWLLSNLDPKDGRVLGTSRIDSQANHLFIVPGARQWAVVEKGPVRGLREQEVKGIYTIPADKITRASTRLGAKQVIRDICQ